MAVYHMKLIEHVCVSVCRCVVMVVGECVCGVGMSRTAVAIWVFILQLLITHTRSGGSFCHLSLHLFISLFFWQSTTEFKTYVQHQPRSHNPTLCVCVCVQAKWYFAETVLLRESQSKGSMLNANNMLTYSVLTLMFSRLAEQQSFTASSLTSDQPDITDSWGQKCAL